MHNSSFNSGGLLKYVHHGPVMVNAKSWPVSSEGKGKCLDSGFDTNYFAEFPRVGVVKLIPWRPTCRQVSGFFSLQLRPRQPGEGSSLPIGHLISSIEYKGGGKTCRHSAFRGMSLTHVP